MMEHAYIVDRLLQEQAAPGWHLKQCRRVTQCVGRFCDMQWYAFMKDAVGPGFTIPGEQLSILNQALR